MSFVDRFFRGGKKLGTVDVAVPALVAELQDAALGRATRPADNDLVLAWLGDGLRALELDPCPFEETRSMVADLDAEGWHRLALFVAALSGNAMREVWPTLHAAAGPSALTARFIAAVKSKPLLTLDLVRQSEHRVEELARALVRSVGALVRGETEAQSTAHLERLDYKRLLAQAEQAKRDAEQRMEALRKRQEQLGAGRRGKW